jgi:hypothetical protein
MTRDLDAKGLEAAWAELVRRGWCDGGMLDRDLPAIIAAYLDAAQPAGEVDRIAVVVDPAGRAFGATYRQATPTYQFLRLERMLVIEGGADGPFARAIVEVKLPRPAEPAVVAGRVVE